MELLNDNPEIKELSENEERTQNEHNNLETPRSEEGIEKLVYDQRRLNTDNDAFKKNSRSLTTHDELPVKVNQIHNTIQKI